MKVLLCNDDLPLTGQLFGRSTMIRKERAACGYQTIVFTELLSTC